MRFPFIRDQEIVVIVILVLNFSLLSTRFPNFSAIYTLWWDIYVADIFVCKSGHESSFLFKRYWLKICIKYNFLNSSIENSDPLHGRSAHRKTNSTSNIVIQIISYYNKYFLKKEFNSASGKKKKTLKKSLHGK